VDQDTSALQKTKRIYTDIDEFLSAVKNAQAGDLIILANGSYPVNSNKNISFSRKGDQDRPIIVRAQDVGEVTLHDLALPPQPGSYHAIKILSPSSRRYFLIEARLQGDNYDAGMTSVSTGIGGAGAVIYWIDEEQSPPVFLRTPTPLQAGTFLDPATGIEVIIVSSVPNRLTVQIRRPEHPDCFWIKSEMANLESEIDALQVQLRDDTGAHRGGGHTRTD
jgi:hypothetical protein